MEIRRSSSICISGNSTVDDYHNSDQCSFEEPAKWQELEQYWGNEKHRLLDFDNGTQLSSSLEKHLLFDDALGKPKEIVSNTAKDENCFHSEHLVRGADINDIPTSYLLSGFKPHELVVIGTYVDKRIIPGFMYKVRKNHTEKYFFDAKAVRLQEIGLGYGKRITFESQSLNENKNYFWSDSCASGFGFSLQAISPGEAFFIINPVSAEYFGRVVVTDIIGNQIERSTIIEQNGRVEKVIEVQFLCDVLLADCSNKQNIFNQGVIASGVAVLVKEDSSCVAEFKRIQLDDFIVKNCELKPEN